MEQRLGCDWVMPLMFSASSTPLPVGARHCGPPAAQSLGTDYAEVLGALALSDRPLRPENLPTVTANPSKVAERLRRKLGAPWIVTDGRGEGKTFEFAVPPGLSAVVIADSRMSIDFNALAWL